jgi:hypothetical protein
MNQTRESFGSSSESSWEDDRKHNEPAEERVAVHDGIRAAVQREAWYQVRPPVFLASEV